MSTSKRQWVSENIPLTHQQKRVATRLWLNLIQNTQKGTLHTVMGKYIKMFPENKNPLSMYCTNCCNILLERVYIFLYGRSFHLILKYCFAVKVKMIAFVKYMPHKKFMAVTVARGPHHGASECGADTGEGATPPHS